MTAARFAQLTSALLLVTIGIGWRSLRQRRRHGTLGITLFARGGAPWRGLLGGVLLPLAIGAHAVVAAFAPRSLASSALPAVRPLQAVGCALFVLGLIGMVLAQLDLGASWRIGIDPFARPGLVTAGAYRTCRNPIFAAMLVALLGTTLLAPTWIAVALYGGAVIAVRMQVRAEERWLATTYGDAWSDYAARVGRFSPWSARS